MMADTKPELFTVAIAVFDEVQVPPEVALVRGVLVAAHSEDTPVMAATDGAAVTVAIAVALHPVGNV